jgi:UDP-N-acetyl-D-glucosamine dehydrogenase
MSPVSSVLRPLPVAARTPVQLPTVAVVGLGYVGLPTSLALHDAGMSVIGLDASAERIRAIGAGAVDLIERDRPRLEEALDSGRVTMTTDPADLAAADAVIICVPTPVDERLRPDLRAVRSACATVVAHARAGQTIVLTSTTYVGTTRELLCGPLSERGLEPGRDIHVVFAPERINPGDTAWEQARVPRVVGGVTPECTAAAARVLGPTAERLHVVSSPEAAELTKLQENTFRALNLAFANEMAVVAAHHGLDPIEIVDAAATKPYGFLAHYPGPGVGGHCIPVDPYYLLSPLQAAGVRLPVIERAMASVAARPGQVAERAITILASNGVAADVARVLICGVAYKPGVADYRESPALQIIEHLERYDVSVGYHDPLVPSLPGHGLRSIAHPRPGDHDLVIVAVTHPGHDLSWLEACPHVLDATYKTPGGHNRHGL